MSWADGCGRRAGWLAAVVLGVCVWGGVAWGQGVTDAEVLAGLNAASFAEREAMSRRVRRGGEVEDGRLRRLTVEARSPEARHRLLAVWRHRFLGRMTKERVPGGAKGAIGVSHRTVSAEEAALGGGGPAGARVVATMPGFPGYEWLEAGDVIVAIDGVAMRPEDGVRQLSQRVQDLTHGAVVVLEVWRRGDRVAVELALGSFNALETVYGEGGALLEPYRTAWRMERALIESAWRDAADGG